MMLSFVLVSNPFKPFISLISKLPSLSRKYFKLLLFPTLLFYVYFVIVPIIFFYQLPDCPFDFCIFYPFPFPLFVQFRFFFVYSEMYFSPFYFLFWAFFSYLNNCFYNGIRNFVYILIIGILYFSIAL